MYVDAEINWYMTQYALKSDRRTSKWIIEFYNYHKKRHPRLDEKQLLTHVIEVCFTISDRKPYQIRRHRFITRKEVEEIVEKSRDVEHLVDNVIKAGYSPDLTPW
ncbi:hypothetical protein KAX75_02260 [candidate division WOR-3 bacterium]|nr:hypothetical protein [candidate division WOR-3 bacterium]